MQNKSSQLYKCLLDIKTEKEMEDFLGLIMTKREIRMILKRIEILKSLKKGLSQRKIAKATNVGIATVIHGARELNSKKWRDFNIWR